MKKRILLRKFVPFLLAVLFAASSGILPAVALTVGQNVGIGKVTQVTTKTIGDDLTFETAIIHENNGMDQSLYTFSFNPQTSDCIPLAYSKQNGYGAPVYDTAVQAEENGYDVKAAVNAAFFVMSKPHTSSNTYGGVNISDGRIMQGDNRFGTTWELIFFSDGRADLVQSRVTYSATVKGRSLPLGHINICPTTAQETDSEIYYYDSFCGTKTDTKAPGVEVVFEKQDGTELTVGGTLVGKVVEIRKNVSTGGTIEENQFVLYASDASYSDTLRSLAIGDTVKINAAETVAASKTAMETCSSAIVTYGYHIVMNGKNVTNQDRLGYEFNTARAQRTALGIKADGSLLIVASDGRKPDTFPGMTVYELADYMIAQGCVTVVNLDGGGSTQVTVEDESGNLKSVFNTESRPVANCLLLVARPNIDAETKDTLRSLIVYGKRLESDGSYTGSKSDLSAALQYAETVADSKTSMPGDYTKAIMRLRETMGIADPPKGEGSLGDIDGNGLVEAYDYVLLKWHILGFLKLPEDWLVFADIDRNGQVEAFDYMLLKRHILGSYRIEDLNT